MSGNASNLIQTFYNNFMGQAKQRGTFDERKKIAIEVNRQIDERLKGKHPDLIKAVKRGRIIRLAENASPLPPPTTSPQIESKNHPH
jgi:hypothetical protein